MADGGAAPSRPLRAFRGTPTAMVAVPVLNSALEQRFAILGGTGTGTKMEASIHLRAKDIAAHERWLANLADVITSNGLDDLWENQQVLAVRTRVRSCISARSADGTTSRWATAGRRPRTGRAAACT